MANKINTNQKHLTQDDRIIIEKCLDAKTTLCHIAQKLGKNPTTIAKEIKNTEHFNSITLSMTSQTVVH